MDREAIAFLDECEELAGVRFTVPLAEVARSALAFIDGIVLRWLVDRDTDATLAALDDLARNVASSAVARTP